MKVLIIDTAPPERATYLNYYIVACEHAKVDYDRFIWDRKTTAPIEYLAHQIIFHEKAPDIGVSKLRKLYPLYKCVRTLKKIIIAGNYTHLILVNTIAPVVLSGFIRKYFKDRYIIDVRDYTYEKYALYKSRVDALINDSAFSVISSKGFYAFLAQNPKIVIAHNISNVNDVMETPTIKMGRQNTIGFVGYVRYKNENWKLIQTLANNPSYDLLYAGDVMPGCNLEELCRQRQIDNVWFLGKFNNRDKGEIYEKIDMINSLYGDFSLEVTTAVPNRYYDALLYKKPILASKGTFLGELVAKKHLGLAVDVFTDDVKSLIDCYIKDFDTKNFQRCCQEELATVLREQQTYEERIKSFLSPEE